MTIDIHTHLPFHALYPQAFLAALVGVAEGEPLPPVLRRWLSDQTGGGLVAEMDKVGVKTSVLLMIDSGVRYADQGLTIEQCYAVHRAVLEHWPGRFVAFGGVDPRRGGAALELFRRSVVDWGFRGLKLYPPMGFSPADPALDPYLDICAERGLPVMTHSGDSLDSLDNDSASPRFVAELARRRPDVTVIMAHGGYSLDSADVRRAVELPNVWVDLAGFQTCERARGWEVTSAKLAWIFRPELNERVLFGSDYPLFHFATGLSDDLAYLERVFELAGEGDRRRFDNVLWRNAERVLGLAGGPP
jgi:hypothetical protein